MRWGRRRGCHPPASPRSCSTCDARGEDQRREEGVRRRQRVLAAGPSPSRVSPPALRAGVRSERPGGLLRRRRSDGDENGARWGRSTVGGGGGRAPTRWRRRREGTRAAGGRGARRRLTRRAVGGARLPGVASGSEPLNLLDESAMRRHMLNQRRGGEHDDDDLGGCGPRRRGRSPSHRRGEGGRKRGRDDEDDFDDGRSKGGKSSAGCRAARPRRWAVSHALGPQRSDQQDVPHDQVRPVGQDGQIEEGRRANTARTGTGRRRAPWETGKNGALEPYAPTGSWIQASSTGGRASEPRPAWAWPRL